MVSTVALCRKVSCWYFHNSFSWWITIATMGHCDTSASYVIMGRSKQSVMMPATHTQRRYSLCSFWPSFLPGASAIVDARWTTPSVRERSPFTSSIRPSNPITFFLCRCLELRNYHVFQVGLCAQCVLANLWLSVWRGRVMRRSNPSVHYAVSSYKTLDIKCVRKVAVHLGYGT
jgi:hypothetical protein